MIALTHKPSPNMQACERTFVPEVPIDVVLAAQQHQAYCSALANCGAEVRVLDANSAMPDCGVVRKRLSFEFSVRCLLGATDLFVASTELRSPLRP
ncbi:MAG: hypothetical protein K8R36_00885 [Planctomycetales bacterium]|nr:hypothetical protein [Planctomycetales bacterium]